MEGPELSLAVPELLLFTTAVLMGWTALGPEVVSSLGDKRISGQLQGLLQGSQGYKQPSHKALGQGSLAMVFWAREWVQQAESVAGQTGLSRGQREQGEESREAEHYH